MKLTQWILPKDVMEDGNETKLKFKKFCIKGKDIENSYFRIS